MLIQDDALLTSWFVVAVRRGGSPWRCDQVYVSVSAIVRVDVGLPIVFSISFLIVGCCGL